MYMFAYIATVFGSRETNITPPDSAHPALCLMEVSDEEVMKFLGKQHIYSWCSVVKLSTHMYQKILTTL